MVAGAQEGEHVKHSRSIAELFNFIPPFIDRSDFSHLAEAGGHDQGFLEEMAEKLKKPKKEPQKLVPET